MNTRNHESEVERVAKQEITNIKRLITAAGKIQDKIADDVAALDKLKKEIKSFEMKMATTPETTVVLVSGTHVAALSAEAEYHQTGPDANKTLFGLLGMDKFLALATFRIDDMKKAVGEEIFNSICPKAYTGSGRKFSLKKKT